MTTEKELLQRFLVILDDDRIDRLSRRSQAAFVAVIAEQSVSGYSDYFLEKSGAQACVACVWRWLVGEESDPSEAQQRIAELEGGARDFNAAGYPAHPVVLLICLLGMTLEGAALPTRDAAEAAAGTFADQQLYRQGLLYEYLVDPMHVGRRIERPFFEFMDGILTVLENTPQAEIRRDMFDGVELDRTPYIPSPDELLPPDRRPRVTIPEQELV